MINVGSKTRSGIPNKGFALATREVHRNEAIARQAKYDALSVQEKIDRLDSILGVGIGAKKQRARLANV